MQQSEGHRLLLPPPFVGQSAMLSAWSQCGAAADPSQPPPALSVHPSIDFASVALMDWHKRKEKEDGRCGASIVLRHGRVMTCAAIAT